MKITDNYSAKFKIWAEERKVSPLPENPCHLPNGVRSISFRSYKELNDWKKSLIKDAASSRKA